MSLLHLRPAQGLVNRSSHFFGAQHRDGSLDLAPAAEVDHVAKRSASIRTLRGLELGKLAIMGHEIGRLGEGLAIFNMNMIVHAYRPI